MKTIGLMSFAGVMLIAQFAAAQEFTEKIEKKLAFEKKGAQNALVVSNINGSINVVGYEGDEILVEVNKKITAKTSARLEKGKQELQLGVVNDVDTIYLYVQDGCNIFSRHARNRWSRNDWGYDSDCRDCNIEYDYAMDFTIKVPSNINVAVSTINEGDVLVENVKGAVEANNINGSIQLAKLVGEARASTINGDLDVDYLNNPPKDCRFYSLNGDINALFPKGLAAELSFESFNGEFFTNIDQIQPLPMSVVKNDEKKNGTKYKVNGNRYQVGNGGVYLDFETFNGNVYLKEK